MSNSYYWRPSPQPKLEFSLGVEDEVVDQVLQVSAGQDAGQARLKLSSLTLIAQLGCDSVRGALQQEVTDCFWVKLAGCTEPIRMGFDLVQVVVERTSAETQASDEGLLAATSCGELGLDRANVIVS